MASPNQRDLGRVFNEVPELYCRVRPGYPDELFADLVTVTGRDERSSVLEVGCGSGQATRSLALLGCSVTAIEAGAEMAALARQRIAAFRKVEVETWTHTSPTSGAAGDSPAPSWASLETRALTTRGLAPAA
ncbi:class I SAM-dependent methyltransferase [Streptomyces sp. NPDC051664]|uniref:class I SAM-dependent methyltransferase n=1 Tax=Streptomyces sp. NPDC051664 TaxID=3365668 RepID=UPI00379C307A